MRQGDRNEISVYADKPYRGKKRCEKKGKSRSMACESRVFFAERIEGGYAKPVGAHRKHRYRRDADIATREFVVVEESPEDNARACKKRKEKPADNA